MHIKKQTLFKLNNCYAVRAMDIHGRQKYFFAANNNSPCYAYDAADGSITQVWDKAGGTMSFIPIHGTEGEFLAVHGFLPDFNAQGTSIAWVTPKSGGRSFSFKTLLRLPYIHRFDIFEVNGIRYILICTVATSKKNPQDWSDPGKLWAGVLPDDLNTPFEIKPVIHGLQKNHGYWRLNWGGEDYAMISSEMGVMSVIPPQKKNGEWTVETILEKPIGDVAVLDIDGDGEDELAVIEPFHGNTFSIYKKFKNGWDAIYQYPKKLTFGHVAYGCSLRGRPTFIGGETEGGGEMFYVQHEPSFPEKFRVGLIDSGANPSNIYVVNHRDRDVILAANFCGEAALYEVTE